MDDRVLQLANSIRLNAIINLSFSFSILVFFVIVYIIHRIVSTAKINNTKSMMEAASSRPISQLKENLTNRYCKLIEDADANNAIIKVILAISIVQFLCFLKFYLFDLIHPEIVAYLNINGHNILW